MCGVSPRSVCKLRITMTDVGALVDVAVTAAANGGHCVGRLDSGQVVFVRHALPGERVRARISSIGKGGRFFNADTVEVLVASPHRITPACEWAGQCGGCDFQHADAQSQQQMAMDVVAGLLIRLGGVTHIHATTTAEALRWVALPHDATGRASRTRTRYLVNADGVLSMRAHHSHDLIPVGLCPLGQPAADEVTRAYRGKPGTEVEFVVDDDGDVITVVDGVADELVTRRVGARMWRLQPTGFWQVHPDAATMLADVVREAVQAQPGEHALDLYSGAGLFAAELATAVTHMGRVDAVESSEESVNDGATALADLEQVTFHHADVRRWLREQRGTQADIIVADPPRAGMGAEVMADMARMQPRVMAYVSCDPATFARDTRAAGEHGYHLASVAVLDMFPMTGHVELVGVFRPGSQDCSGCCG